jgi:hypothetical protein
MIDKCKHCKNEVLCNCIETLCERETPWYSEMKYYNPIEEERKEEAEK